MLKFKISVLLSWVGLGWFQLAACQQTNATSKIIHPNNSFHIIVIPKKQLAFFEQQPQITFWRSVISLTKDSCIVVHKDSRKMLDIISAELLDSMVGENQLDEAAQCYRDKNGYETCELVKFVRGKKEFFNFQKVGPLVDDAKIIFDEYGVNPIYAQFILLIESPNNPKARSISGAVGHYQLMPFVAKKYGLVVSATRDDRHDFAKSSMAAAKLMKDYCIPNAERMAISVGLVPNQEELWFQLLVMHIYNAGAGNVRKAIQVIGPGKSGEELILKLWKTQAGAFGNSSQNYTQLALASYVNYMNWLNQSSN